jgi:hypothetical protein
VLGDDFCSCGVYSPRGDVGKPSRISDSEAGDDVDAQFVKDHTLRAAGPAYPPASRSAPRDLVVSYFIAAETAEDSIGIENIGKSYAIALSCSSADVAAVQSVSVITR